MSLVPPPMRRRLNSAPSVRPERSRDRGADDGDGDSSAPRHERSVSRTDGDIKAMVGSVFGERKVEGCAEGQGFPSQQHQHQQAAEFSGLGGLGSEETWENGNDARVGSDSGMGAIEQESPVDGQDSISTLATSSTAEGGKNVEGTGVLADNSAHAARRPSMSSIPKWSETLKTPSKGEVFSPSREMSKSGNLHGLGLRVAADRAKSLSRCSKRCATLLADVSALHDAFAQTILKSCEALSSLNGEESPIFPPPVAALVTETNRCLMSFAKQTQGLAICMKGSVARPLHGSSSAMAEAVPSIFNRYALTRAKCANARQNAIKMRHMYAKAVREAEAAIRDLKRAKAEEEPKDGTESGRNTPLPLDETPGEQELTAPPSPPTAGSDAADTTSIGTPEKKVASKAGWDDVKRRFGKKHGLSKSSDMVMKALDDVQVYEAEYCRLVREENQAVSRSEAMELMALEALQKLEEERLQFFMETLSRALQAEKGALDNMSLRLRKGSDDVDSVVSSSASADFQLSPSRSQSPSSLFNIVISQSEDSSAVPEVLALNMPEEVGRWRDTQKRNLQIQANYTRAVKAVATYFEDVASASIAFSSGLRLRLASEGYIQSKSKSTDALAVTLNECEGDRALACWNKVIESLGACSKSASELGTKIRSDGHKLLGKFVLSAEKDLRSAIDSEEMRWKHCLDHAKSEAKARSKYEQAVTSLEKARQKMISADKDYFDSRKEEDSVLPSQNSTMTKALGNMFSMLPSGGEEAMSKMLTSEQRLAIAKKTLQEKTAKEIRDKAAYEAAQVAKEKAVSSYTSTAQAADNQCNSSAESLWTAISTSFEIIVSCFQHFRECRYDNVEPATAKLNECGGALIMEDMAEWAKAMQEKLTAHLERSERGEVIGTPGGKRLIKLKHGMGPAKCDEGYSLQVQLEDSENVYKLLEFVTSEGDEPFSANDGEDLTSDIEEDDEDLTQLPAIPMRPKLCSVADLSVSDHARNKATNATIDFTRSTSLPVVPRIDRQVSVATKELKALAETLKDVNAEKNAASPTKQSKVDAETTAASTLTKQSAETELFLTHFCEEGVGAGDDSTPPTVIDSFSCAYWPKESEGFISPLLHGRMFVTSSTMYFIGWGDKKIVLNWEDVTSVTKATNMMGTIDNSLRITYDTGDGESNYFFGSFAYRDKAFELLNRLSTVARSLTEITVGKSKKGKKVPDVPPDETMKKMETVLQKKIKKVSVHRFYETCWSEGNKTDAGPFYRTFLETKKSHDISVGDWQFAEDGSDGFEHKWSGEKFTQKRVVKFKFTRTTHLYVGPPVAGVTQTQYCRIEGDDKFVLTMTVEMDGIPYADCFAVEVRWVARRVGIKDLSVDVGVIVDFKKSTMLQSKIRSGTITETKPIHVHLFEAAKEACAAGSEGEEDNEEEEEEEEEPPESTDQSMMAKVLKAMLSGVQAIFRSRQFQAIISSATSQLENSTTRQILGGVLIIMVLLFWSRYSTQSPSIETDSIHLTKSDVDDMAKRMDQLSEEMAEVREVLREILSLLKESTGTSDEL